MIAALKKEVWKANLDLARHGLVISTFGNVSGMDRKKGLVAIKPSGTSYESLKPADMVVVDLEGRTVEGALNPSSDTPTHLEIYKAFPEVSAVAHTHSEFAAVFAQAGMEIPCLGTTHADHFAGRVPLTRRLSLAEAAKDYESAVGRAIVERFGRLEPLEMPGVLVSGHGPFTWGRSAGEAVLNSLLLETVARMAWETLILNPRAKPLAEPIRRKHFLRKHGPGAYYGQGKKGVSK